MDEVLRKPDPDFIIRLVGPGIKPWVVPMRALARVMEAAQRLVDQREDDFEADEGEESVAEPDEKTIGAAGLRALRLVGLKSQSAGYAVAATAPELSMSVLTDTGKAIKSPGKAAWNGYQISSIKELSEVAKSQGCVIEFRRPDKGKRQGDVLAKITPLTFSEIAESAFTHGEATVYGKLERLGGATEPHCGMRLADYHKMVICHIASTNLIRRMGPFLYQDIVVSGDATWLRYNGQLKDLKITSFEEPKTGKNLDVLDKLHKLGGYGWDKVRDPEKALAEMRGVSKSSPKLLVAVDSMTLVWGIRKVGPKEKLERAKLLFYQLDRDNRQIVVPSIVVAEYLSHVELKFHAETIELMQSKFFLPPFDANATSLAAELFKLGQAGRANKGAPDSRKCLRADTLIVASAKIAGVKSFYSHDKNCRALAVQAKMAAYDLPGIDDELFPDAR